MFLISTYHLDFGTTVAMEHNGCVYEMKQLELRMRETHKNYLKHLYIKENIMSKEMREQIDNFKKFILKESKKTKYQISFERENERLLNLYPNIKFSPKWNNETIPRYMENDGTTFDEEYNKWKIYYTKNLLEPFDIFYKKYKPYNQPKSLDLYYFQDLKQTDGLKEQFDKIINGELYVDVEFMTPDSPIRNYMKIISFDENKLKR